MSPETRSRGVAPASRIYHTTPSLQQVQFASRRKRVRTYGRQARREYRQQTLTQIDFVVGPENGMEILDSEDEDQEDQAGEEQQDKENQEPAGASLHEPMTNTASKRPSEERVDRSKRRRTLGHDGERARDATRRKTLGHVPSTASDYHTQTLTQIYRPDIIADSEDEGPGEEGADQDDQGFLCWLGEGQQHVSERPLDEQHDGSGRQDETPDRQPSVIPQTPAAPHSPASNMLPRYGPVEDAPSPLTPLSEIADSDDDAALELDVLEEPQPPKMQQTESRPNESLSQTPRNHVAKKLHAAMLPDSPDNAFAAGLETQLVMNYVASITSPPRGPEPGLESQRVPLSILQSLPPPMARSDALMPVSPVCLTALLSGTPRLLLPFKIPSQVCRLWLLGTTTLRYMACLDAPVQSQASQFVHPVSQVYELNDPLSEPDMRLEGWIHGRIPRYLYLPPAAVGQLLWNLRHALFANPQSQPPLSSLDISHQVSAQIRSDLAASTQTAPPDTSPTPPPPPPPAVVTARTALPTPSRLRPSQASALDTSQLLTRSQTLPDSLLRDHQPPPHLRDEIWDSEDDPADF
ncbi:hypothetical protein CDD82_7753 [Ophiocordyceps australis]|uniref:Uncharacterized protein n=1 Tax=Ophiocordyceps australis TaxID=1399860 RepID=A0A2C5YQ42_9HYPO|nr:hypothetical protein CDD82_7753 [Ophiocordyceps australis]